MNGGGGRRRPAWSICSRENTVVLSAKEDGGFFIMPLTPGLSIKIG